jgi:hypothetical protein
VTPLIAASFAGYILWALLSAYALVRHYFKTRED